MIQIYHRRRNKYQISFFWANSKFTSKLNEIKLNAKPQRQIQSTHFFFFFWLLFAIMNRKSSRRRLMTVYISLRGSLQVFDFSEKKNKKMECRSEFFNFIPIYLGQSSQLLLIVIKCVLSLLFTMFMYMLYIRYSWKHGPS